MNWLKNIALICITSFVTIAIIEVAFRFYQSWNVEAVESRKIAGLPLHDFEHHFCYGPKDHQKFDPEVVSREYENQQYFEFRNQSVALHTYDENGFRIAGSTEAKENGVIVVGDSFVRGTLADDTETIPAVLNRWYPDTEFHNFGIGGHGPKQYLKTYQANSSTIEHDLVILVLYLGNDAQNDLGFESRLARAKELYELQQQRGLSYATKMKIKFAAILDKSAVGDVFLKSYRNLKNKDAVAPNAASLPTARELSDQLVTSVSEFKAYTDSVGKKLQLVTIPSREYFDSERFPVWQQEFAVEVTDHMEAALDDFAEGHGLPPVVHILPMLQAEFDKGKALERIYGWPDAHFTEYAYFLTAREISNALASSLGYSPVATSEFVNATEFDPAHLNCPSAVES
ncbi:MULTISPECIES: SGNH/GDSL hydrolase family protein [Halocynthiibacter]|uniref:SGNH/GDSL hydrolase family protein n=1 Tax=Halocynthiibacter halioticoli TaxID=2986804 RepID=A0AAE3LS62_9RHOB|nr:MULTISPECIES: SGNH/GDSL hydrolase family protein [Halocynthiibacter]MCV6825433.1 SGNH/GDSL hydrolase family protein [Halocynthiibacter halioticoli]MCW4058434.1 SGNH/GDSL hydrolase family protein [Halocynthiibacter sp. SDUM655004]